MKVVHVTHRYPPAIGGAEVWLREIAGRSARDHGLQVEVHALALHEEAEYGRHFAPAERVGAYGEFELDGPVEVHRHPVSVPPRVVRGLAKAAHRHLGLYLQGPHSWSLYRALPQAIREADLVHLHTHPYPHILYGLRLARRIGRPVVVTPHFHPAMELHLGRRSLAALGRADRVFVVTEHERDALIGHGLAPERLVVTGNGVDLDQLRELAQRPTGAHLDLERRAGCARVGFLGRKVDYKGLDVLIAALRRLRETRAIELLLVGPGSAWFERQLAALPAEERGWIRDLGVLGESDKLAALRSCDLLVQPSPHEAFGIVFLEAWACGLPVIGADSGAVPSVVERGGLVFEPGDAGALATAVARLLDEPETARRCAARGLQRVQGEFSWDRLATRVVETYRELVPRPRRVLVVSALYPPRTFGGAEVMARAGAIGLAARGCEVQVFGTYRDVVMPRWESSTRRDQGTLVHDHAVRPADDVPGTLRHHRVPEAEVAFAALLRRWRPDVVHFHNLQTLGHRLIDIAEDAGIATLMTLHDYWPICFKHTRMLDDGSECPGNGLRCLGCRRELLDAPQVGMLERNAQVRSSIDRLRLLLTPASYIAARFEGDGIPRERLRRHPYGIEQASLRRVAAARRPRHALRLGFVGYIGAHKGVFVLAQAALGLRGDFELVVYGVGAGQAELARQLAPLGARAQLRGPCAHERIHEAFAEIDVLVLPALWPDNFPVSILEALASGAVVVASDAGGMPEQITHDVNGYLVPQGDVQGLQRTLQGLIDDRQCVARLAAGALESSAAYSLEVYLERLEALYAEAHRARPTRRRSRPLVVHTGLHDDAGAQTLYRALALLSEQGLELEPLAARHAEDEHVEQACCVVLTGSGDDAAELALRALAADSPLLAGAGDADARQLLQRAPSGSTYADSHDLAERLRELLESRRPAVPG